MEENVLIKLQKTQNSMLNAIVDVCEKNNIKYWLGCGTLLGAVRHNGFIPWDDDIDVLIPYDDYLRFLEIGQEQLGSEYFLQTNKTDCNWYRSYATVRKNGTTCMMRYNSRHNSHQGIWIDIFPVIQIGGKLDILVKKYLLTISNWLIMDDYYKANIGEFSEKLGSFGTCVFNLLYSTNSNWRRFLNNSIVNWIGRKKRGKQATYIWTSITVFFPLRCIHGDPEEYQFENRRYKAFHDTHSYLVSEYGESYMTPYKDVHHDDLIIDFDNNWDKYYKKKEDE